MRLGGAGRAVLVALLVSLGAVAAYVAVPLLPASPPPSHGGLGRIQHIFVVVQENRAFDNYFGAYCPATGPACPSVVDGLDPGLCVPNDLDNPGAGCTAPYALPAYYATGGDLPHNWSEAHRAWDSGRMDGFIQAALGNTTTMGYYTANTVSLYWDLAQQYGLGDGFFSSAMTGSLANHWYLVAGSAPADSYQNTLPTFVRAGSLTPAGSAYLNESNSTATVADQLESAGVSWKVYDYAIPLGGYQEFISKSRNTTFDPVGTVFDDFNPFAAKASSYASGSSAHFVSRYSLFTDLSAGQAPNVSWVLPSIPQSDHPPASPYAGERWVLSVVNAIEQSPLWSSSVILLTWDDYGGWYDHVAPPNEGTYGPGLRVPLLVIGPYVREGFVNHAVSTFSGIPELIEIRYGLPFLDGLGGSGLSLLDYFDFTHAPRAPLTFSVNESYPQAAEPLPGSPAGLSGPAAPPSDTGPPGSGLGFASGFEMTFRGDTRAADRLPVGTGAFGRPELGPLIARV